MNKKLPNALFYDYAKRKEMHDVLRNIYQNAI